MEQLTTAIEVWGGLECTINRVHDQYFDQLDYAGHYNREPDISRFAELGIKKIRYPVLWEKHQPLKDASIDWTLTANRLEQLRLANIEVIAGLVHHGSGPAYVNMMDETFVQGLAEYASKVAEKFPWINYYTPVNEPLTTARFCGLYGIWYPHQQNDRGFCRILINECKATVLAMQAIRKINPQAKLVQTDDLGKIHSTPLLQYQADFENNRRWLSYDLLCGKVNQAHSLWKYLLSTGITESELDFFLENKCEPDIMGFNYYLTSERYLDENLQNYPAHTHGRNSQHHYADVEAVRVGHVCPDGPYQLLKEAWERYHLPLAVTEVHLFCTREEQMRWLNLFWKTAVNLKKDGIDIRAITAWALLGSYGWNRLLTQEKGEYEAGVFDLSVNTPRPTALAGMIKAYNAGNVFQHPVINNNGWWQRKCRVIYGSEAIFNTDPIGEPNQPLLIIGKSGTLANAFAIICESRGIDYQIAGHDEADITNPLQLEKLIREKNPWGIVNTAGFVSVDDAETRSGSCFAINTYGAENLAVLCNQYDIKLLTFSTDLVFDGLKTKPYLESDKKIPLNVYGHSKALAEEKVLKQNRKALVVRTAAFFGPWDNANFLQVVLKSLKMGKTFTTVNDVLVSPTYVPDLVNASLDLLLDDENGIWHLNNKGQISWADLAFTVAERCGLNTGLIKSVPLIKSGLKAKRPRFSVLTSERGDILPSLDIAIDQCLKTFK
ncbi:MAG: sugar nucleotide-binding protein [Mucilaginibacter sp.]|nr:sugar nucleotide-binding protein [Mucilaginibacter sp.]